MDYQGDLSVYKAGTGRLDGQRLDHVSQGALAGVVWKEPRDTGGQEKLEADSVLELPEENNPNNNTLI